MTDMVRDEVRAGQYRETRTQIRRFKSGAVGLSGRAGGEAVGGGAWQTVSRRQRAVQGGEAAAGVEQVGLFGDFPEQGAAFLPETTKSA